MTEKEIRERFTKALYELVSREMSDFIEEYEVATRKPRTWEDNPNKEYWYKKADSLLSILREHGFVQLDDQTLPYRICVAYGSISAYNQAQQDMISAGFRRVKP